MHRKTKKTLVYSVNNVLGNYKLKFKSRNMKFPLYLAKFSLFPFVFVLRSSKFVKFVFVLPSYFRKFVQ